MRNKATLVLMEQLIMLLVFALAAALCLQAFVLCDRLSRENQARERAALECQNAAEVLAHFSGDYTKASALLGGVWDGDAWEITYAEDWSASASEVRYTLTATPEASETPLLGAANVAVYDTQGTCLFQLPASWQKEVASDG